MKLRLRRLDTKETLKYEFLDTCTLHDLRRRINASSPSSVHLSLNRKDELVAPSPDDTLRSLGLTSGDLIYCSLEPFTFDASAPEAEGSAGKLGEHETLVREFETIRETESGSTGTASEELCGVQQNPVNMDIQNQANTDLDFGGEEPIEGSPRAISGMEVPAPMDVELDGLEFADARWLSEPLFLKKVLLEECTDTSESMILAMAVHAVMLESGFSLLDPGSGVRAKKFSFLKEMMLSVSLSYSLPELISRRDCNTNETVSLKFQSLGHMLIVYGSLGGASTAHRVYLDSRRFVPTIDLVMDTLKCDKEGTSSMYHEVFEFWRMVKDGLVMPLLIGLCDKTGLELPPCLMRLPTELKLKILESLPGVYIARVACLCSEMRYVASNNDLWKQKCLEEFGNLVKKEEDVVSWKAKFAAFWENQWPNIVARRIRPSLGRFPIWRDPVPMGFHPGAWYDGDRDRLPAGLQFQLGQRGAGFGQLRGRNLPPRCNLGGLI